MKMLRLLLVSLAVIGAVSGQSCYEKVKEDCGPRPGNFELQTCNAIYGAFGAVASEMQAYANLHLQRSFEFLLSSTFYNNYETNREGFAKLFRKMSDDAWEKSIDLIKHITKRGGMMDFSTRSRLDSGERNISVVELNEIGSMSRALDTHKELAERAFHIHREATRNKDSLHDAEVAHYLEEEFMESQAGTVRDLAGHTNDLKRFISGQHGNDLSLSLYLFDEYLKKVV